jgi:pimeloyl-ACP methyl ester carboxylesterase
MAWMVRLRAPTDEQRRALEWPTDARTAPAGGSIERPLAPTPPPLEVPMFSSSTPSEDLALTLHDGRAIGAATVGPRDGAPVVHCHGSGSSRLEVTLLADAAAAAGVRLIGLDRPGVGRSDPKPGARLLEWPAAVAEVADQLGIERFAVEGLSAGGPFALACAYAIPQRLTACGLISTIAPPDMLRKAGARWMRAAAPLAARFPRLVLAYARLVQRQTGTDATSTARYLAHYASRLGPADQALLADTASRTAVARAMAESFRQGSAGNLETVLVEIQPWGFQPAQVPFERLFLWHGEQDYIAPVAAARLLAQALPHCTATFYPQEGHFSTVANHAQEIWSALRG